MKKENARMNGRDGVVVIERLPSWPWMGSVDYRSTGFEIQDLGLLCNYIGCYTSP